VTAAQEANPLRPAKLGASLTIQKINIFY